MRRPMLSDRAAYWLAVAVVGLCLFASVTPSPLYPTYGALFALSPSTLTLIYATYAFGVLVPLLFAGHASDDVGRRPVLLGSLAALMIATALFAVADSATWLFVARGLQGLATGAALSAASAAMLDLHSRRDPSAVGLANGVASAGGVALGILASSALVQLGDQPRVLPFVLLLVLLAVALAGAYWMPEPVAAPGRFRLTAEAPSVPPVVRAQFLVAALAVLASWSIGGLFFSLGPALGAHLFASTNAVVDDVGIVTLTGTAAVAQLVLGRTRPWVGASTGSLALAIGMVLIVVSAASNSTATFLAGAIVGGAGFGLAFLGGLRALVSAIPPDRRAAVMSAFYIVAYAALSIPAVVAGLLVSDLGLETTFEAFGSVIAAIAIAVAWAAWRTRPRPEVFGDAEAAAEFA
ncbi:MAG: MFS transporter [Solirubrobacteraceae bacterium]